MLDADADMLNAFISAKSNVNLDSAEDIQDGHHSLASFSTEGTLDYHCSSESQTVPFRLSNSRHLPNTFQANGHQSSASATDLLKEPTHTSHQASFEISNDYYPTACATSPSINPTHDLHHILSDVPNGEHFVTLKKMQNDKMDLGPHASIVVPESKLLSNTDPLIKPAPVYVDTDYLGVAEIAAVSK